MCININLLLTNIYHLLSFYIFSICRYSDYEHGMFRVLFLQYDRPIGFQIINNGMGCCPSSRSYSLRKVLSYLLCLIGFGNNTNSYLSFIFVKLATFRGWIPRSGFDMEGNYYNFTYNCKWGTISTSQSIHGLTTAASVWLAAAVGVAVGGGSRLYIVR